MKSIHRMRSVCHMTQYQLALQLGVDRSTVAKWEIGKSKPLADKLVKIAKILNCTVDELLREDGDADGTGN